MFSTLLYVFTIMGSQKKNNLHFKFWFPRLAMVTVFGLVIGSEIKLSASLLIMTITRRANSG